MINQAQNKDLKEIAKVHIKCFPDYFLTKYGEKLLARYYKEYLEEGDPFVVARENDAIIGFCMGHIGQSNARKRFLKRNFINMAFRTLGLMITFDKEVYSRIRGSILPNKEQNNTDSEETDEAYLLSLCVLENMRGTGLAKKLVEAFEEELLKKGCKEYVLFAIEDNERGIGFYEKMGFEQIQRKDGSIKFHKKI